MPATLCPELPTTGPVLAPKLPCHLLLVLNIITLPQYFTIVFNDRISPLTVGCHVFGAEIIRRQCQQNTYWPTNSSPHTLPTTFSFMFSEYKAESVAQEVPMSTFADNSSWSCRAQPGFRPGIFVQKACMSHDNTS